MVMVAVTMNYLVYLQPTKEKKLLTSDACSARMLRLKVPILAASAVSRTGKYPSIYNTSAAVTSARLARQAVRVAGKMAPGLHDKKLAVMKGE